MHNMLTQLIMTNVSGTETCTRSLQFCKHYNGGGGGGGGGNSSNSYTVHIGSNWAYSTCKTQGLYIHSEGLVHHLSKSKKLRAQGDALKSSEQLCFEVPLYFIILSCIIYIYIYFFFFNEDVIIRYFLHVFCIAEAQNQPKRYTCTFAVILAKFDPNQNAFRNLVKVYETFRLKND